MWRLKMLMILACRHLLINVFYDLALRAIAVANTADILHGFGIELIVAAHFLREILINLKKITFSSHGKKKQKF